VERQPSGGYGGVEAAALREEAMEMDVLELGPPLLI